MTKVEKTFTILLYYYYYYDYDFIIINTVSPSLATTILTFPLQKLQWVLISLELIFWWELKVFQIIVILVLPYRPW